MMLALFLCLQQDPDQALKDFEKAWSKNRDRGSAIVAVSMCRSDSILDSLISKLKDADRDALLEGLVKGIRQYENRKSVDTLYSLLKGCEKKPAVFQAAVEGIAMGEKLSRDRVDELHKYLGTGYDQNMSVQVSVVRALGRVRHKSSIVPLLRRLKKAQQDMQAYIGKPPPGCDGD